MKKKGRRPDPLKALLAEALRAPKPRRPVAAPLERWRLIETVEITNQGKSLGLYHRLEGKLGAVRFIQAPPGGCVQRTLEAGWLLAAPKFKHLEFPDPAELDGYRERFEELLSACLS